MGPYWRGARSLMDSVEDVRAMSPHSSSRLVVWVESDIRGYAGVRFCNRIVNATRLLPSIKRLSIGARATLAPL